VYIKINPSKALLLVTSITQLLSPALSSLDDSSQSSNTSPAITPAGYTFAVWGVITLLSFGYGIYQILPNRKNSGLHNLVNPKLIALYVLFTLWLLAAEKDWLIITVCIFVAMFFLAFFSFQQIIQPSNQLTTYDKVLLEAQVGIYLGWCTVAIFANTGSALKFYGLPDVGTTGIVWQTILLIAALTNGIYGLYKTKSNYFFAGTIVWAFVGIFFGLINKPDTLILQIVVLGAIVTFLIVLLKFSRRPNPF
jgi:hypothetical protein